MTSLEGRPTVFFHACCPARKDAAATVMHVTEGGLGFMTSALEQGFVCEVDIPLRNAGVIRMQTAVRDKRSGHIGSANVVIIVPDLKKKGPALSGITLSGTDPARDDRSKPAEQLPLSEQPDPVVPIKANPAVRQFRVGSQVYYALEVYNAKVDDLSRRPRLTYRLRIWRDGKVVLETPLSALVLRNQTDWKQITVTGSLTLTKAVVPGQYIFQLTICDELAAAERRNATQSMDFEVVH